MLTGSDASNFNLDEGGEQPWEGKSKRDGSDRGFRFPFVSRAVNRFRERSLAPLLAANHPSGDTVIRISATLHR